MLISEKSTSENLIYQHLYKYYDVLNWGEDLGPFLNENITFYRNYQGQFIQFKKDNNIVGGLLLYFNSQFNSHVIGCAAIDPMYRRKGLFKEIIINFNHNYPRLYFFCKPNLVNFYFKHFKYSKEIPLENIFLISNYLITNEDQGPFF